MRLSPGTATTATAAALTLALLAAGCAANEPGDRSSSDPEQSEQPIKNGEAIPADQLPSVVMLDLQPGVCTGTFITDSVVLTAAHCLMRSSSAGDHVRERVSLVRGTERVASEAIRVHPRYPNMGVEFDLGFVVFPKGTSAHTSAVGDRPAKGQKATLVGFGIDHGPDDVGVKRAGTNVVRDLTEVAIYVNDAGSPYGNTVPRPGDSGGPLLVDGRIVGVAHDPSTYVALHSASSRSFLRTLPR